MRSLPPYATMAKWMRAYTNSHQRAELVCSQPTSLDVFFVLLSNMVWMYYFVGFFSSWVWIFCSLTYPL